MLTKRIGLGAGSGGRLVTFALMPEGVPGRRKRGLAAMGLRAVHGASSRAPRLLRATRWTRGVGRRCAKTESECSVARATIFAITRTSREGSNDTATIGRRGQECRKVPVARRTDE